MWSLRVLYVWQEHEVWAAAELLQLILVLLLMMIVLVQVVGAVASWVF